MDSKEGVTAGVKRAGSEAPSNYHVAVKTENPNQVAVISPPTAVAVGLAATMERAVIAVPTVISPPTSVAVGGTATMERQRRGRPRKYGPSGTLARALSPMPISSSAPPPTSAESSAAKQGVGQAIDLENNQWYNVGVRYAGDYHDLVPCSAEACFIPHLINIEQGEDITMKILSFHDQQPRALCVLSAIGLTSNVKLRQPGSSGVILTFEGIFQILTLTGLFTHTEFGSLKGSRSGGLSVTLVGSDGRMIGGMLAGLLIATGPVKVVVGSFMPKDLPNGHANDLQQQKRKKKKRVPKSTPIAISSASMFPNTVGNEHYRTPEQNNSATPMPNLDSPLIRTVNRDSWEALPTPKGPPLTSTHLCMERR